MEDDERSWRGSSIRLFYPIESLMNRLSYAKKFVVIGAFFLPLLLAVTYLQISETEKQRYFNYKEAVGVKYVNPASAMLRSVQLARLYNVAVLAGSREFETKLKEQKETVAKLITTIDGVRSQYAKDMLTEKGEDTVSKRWDEIKGLWTTTQNKTFASQRECIDEYSKVTVALNDWILNYLANFSNLILDPDLDSYWLMDAYVTKLPALSETMSLSAAKSIEFSTRAGSLSQDERLTLSGAYTVIGTTADDLININLKGSADFNRDRGGKLEGAITTPYNAASKAAKEFADSVRVNVLNPQMPSVSVVSFVKGAEDTKGSVFDLWNTVGPELDKLIDARVRAYRLNIAYGILIALIAVVVVFYIFTGFFYAVKNSISRITDFTGDMLSGTTEKFSLPAKDELGNLSVSYNQINAALVEARTLRAKVEQENTLLQANIFDLLKIVADAADGDLTVRAKVTEGALGNIADALNQMLESWSNVIGEIKKMTNKTENAIGEIRTASERMTSGAAQQTTSILAASQSIQKMSISIQGVSENAETAAAAAKRTQESALAGSESVQNVVRGMDLLRTNVQAGAKKIKNLGDRSMEITTIVATIAKISDQTNMLALNAAIEAARAGEHGRGFSVVADEVRKLAERTAAATHEIEKLVKDIQTETNESVGAIEKQTQVVEEEAQVVGKAGENLLKIQEVSTQSATLISEISSTAKTQVEGATAVVRTMENISTIAAMTQTGADNTVKITRDLATLSTQLSNLVDKFKSQEPPVLAGQPELAMSR